VCPLHTEAAGLLGPDFLEEREATINSELCKISLNDTARDSRAHGNASTEHRVLTIFTTGKEGHSPQPVQRTEEKRRAGPRQPP